MAILNARSDPAPSRIAYRLYRWWLTPFVRLFVLLGLPLLALAAATWWTMTRTPFLEVAHAYAVDVRRTIEERPEFMVKVMAIDGGSDELGDDIREILPLDFPVSSFDLELHDIRERVEELDAVASASVRVRSGGILQVDIVERVPAVVWRGPQGLELLDAEGHRVAPLARRSSRPDLPLFVGEGAETALQEGLRLLAEAEPLRGRLRGFVRVGARRWDVILDRGQRIQLPETGAEIALKQIIALHEVHDLLARDVVTVDYRNPSRPTLRTSEETLNYMRSIKALGAGVDANE